MNGLARRAGRARRRFAALVGLCAAGAGAPPLLPGQAGQISYEAFSLPNGLRVVYAIDHTAPIVTVDVWYATGARNERPRRASTSS